MKDGPYDELSLGPPQFASGEDMKRTLRDLIAKFESGEITTAALRVYNKDGTYADVVIGRTAEEKEAARIALQEMHKKAN